MALWRAGDKPLLEPKMKLFTDAFMCHHQFNGLVVKYGISNTIVLEIP